MYSELETEFEKKNISHKMIEILSFSFLFDYYCYDVSHAAKMKLHSVVFIDNKMACNW